MIAEYPASLSYSKEECVMELPFVFVLTSYYSLVVPTRWMTNAPDGFVIRRGVVPSGSDVACVDDSRTVDG